MTCQEHDRLQTEFAGATLAVGRHAESLLGKAKTIEDEREADRLEEIRRKKSRAVAAHDAVHLCQSLR